MPRRKGRKTKDVADGGEVEENSTSTTAVPQVEEEDNNQDETTNGTPSVKEQLHALSLMSLKGDLEYVVMLNKLEKEMATKTLEAISLGVKGDCPVVAAKCNQVIKEYLEITKDIDVDGIGMVVDHAEFVFLLKRWITSKFNALKLEALSLLRELASSEKFPLHLEKIKGLGLVTDLVGLLASSNDETVCQEALLTFESLFKHDLLVREVVSSPKFLFSLTKLTNRDHHEPFPLANRTANLLCTLAQHHRQHLSVGSVKSMMSTLRVMMDIKDTGVLGRAVHCIGTLCSFIDGAFEIFLRGGLVLRVVALLSNDAAKEAHPQVRICIAAFAKTEEKALTLFKLLKGTTHLKQFWRIWLEDGEMPTQKQVGEEVLLVLSGLGKCPYNATAANALIKCGMMYSLVQCLKSEVTGAFKQAAISCIAKSTCDLTPTERRALLDAGILPLLVALLQSEDGVTLTMCVCTIGNVVQSNGLVRDKFLSYGVADTILKLLRKHLSNPCLLKPLMAAFQMIISVGPKAPLEFYRDLPRIFDTLIEHYTVRLPHDPELAIAFLLVFDEYTSHGEDAVHEFMELSLLTKLLPLTTCPFEMVRQATCTILLIVLESATAAHKQAILDGGVLVQLCSLLQPSSSLSCQLAAIRTLLSLTDEPLVCPPVHQHLLQSTLIPLLLQGMETHKEDILVRSEFLGALDVCMYRYSPIKPIEEPKEKVEDQIPLEA